MNDIIDIRIGDVLTRPKMCGVIRVIHIGVVVGPNSVLQNTPGKGEHLATIEEFCAGQPTTIHRPGLNPAVVVERARDILSNPQRYDLIQNNCEHTASKVVHGAAKSAQVASFALIALGLGGLLWLALRRR